jgi:hypothetical protein
MTALIWEIGWCNCHPATATPYATAAVTATACLFLTSENSYFFIILSTNHYHLNTATATAIFTPK